MRLSFLSLALLAVLAGCSRPAPTATGPAASPVAVHSATVVAEFRPAMIELPATVRPAERAVISAKLTGTIATLPWGLGQEAKAGDLLLTLAAPEAEARVRQAQASLAEALRATDRERTLVAKGVNPADALRDAEDRLRFAEATLAEAEALLAYASVRAPFTGVITEKYVLPGDLATPGLPLLVLESTGHLRADGSVPEQAAAALHPGDTLPVVVSDGAPSVAGTIEELSAAADAVSRSVLVKVALPAGTARSGQFARLQVVLGTSESFLVPAAAVSRFGQMERVFAVVDGRAQLRLVQTGRTVGDRVEVLAGLRAGEPVVLAPPADLRDGLPLTLLP